MSQIIDAVAFDARIESGEEKVILTALCGHGLLDLAAYDAYLSGRMTDSGLSDDALREAVATVPSL